MRRLHIRQKLLLTLRTLLIEVPPHRSIQFIYCGLGPFVTLVPGLVTQVGTGTTNIYGPTGIASFPGVKDFVLTHSSEGVAYGVVWMRYEKSADFHGWLPKFDPANPEDRSRDFLRPFLYLLPEAVAIDRGRRDVFIADAGRESISKFNSRGQFKAESFGSVRSGSSMKRPTGLAFFEEILYVLDGQKGEIQRYRLSTVVPR